MKKVIVFGTFDILHKGHLNFFKQAKKFGDFLIVVVARDENVKKIKGKLPVNNEEERLKVLKNNNLVSKAILGSVNNHKDKNNDDYKYFILETEKPDVICLGYDQKIDKKVLLSKIKQLGFSDIKIIKLKPYQPEKYKSSLLIKDC